MRIPLKKVQQIVNNDRLILVYYLVFSVFVFAYSCRNPELNWDLIPYVASAKALETNDKEQIHSFTYDHLQKAVSSSKFQEMTGQNYDYRNTMAMDPRALYLQLHTYQIRFIYLIFILMLYKAGMDIVFATYFISALAMFISIWLIFLICKELKIAAGYMAALPLLALSFGMMSVASLSTPDSLTILGYMICAYLFIKKRIELFIIIPFLSLLRCDVIFFSVFSLLYFIIFSQKRRVLAAVSLLATIFIYWIDNHYYKYPGWSTMFYLNFVTGPTVYFTAIKKITFMDYTSALTGGIKRLMDDKSFLVFFGISVLFAFLSYAKNQYNKIVTGGLSEMCIFTTISFVYVIVHFFLFPIAWERFFLGQYLIATVGLFAVLSNRTSRI